jgi:hypothetical protein
MSAPAQDQLHYRVCGLRFTSTIPFPELHALPPSDGEFNTDIEFGMESGSSICCSGDVVMTTDGPEGPSWLTCTRTTQGYRLRFSQLADFLVDRAGRQVICIALPETPPETIRHLFLDQVIPPLLNLRGREALHASAVGIAGCACAFIGISGQGKSTLASAFHVAGYPLLCDDCLVLNENAAQLMVEPAYPGLRLWDDSRSLLFGQMRPTLPVSHYNQKRRIATPAPEYPTLLPLRCIYSLLRDEKDGLTTTPLIESLSIRDAFMELVLHAFRLDLTDQAMILRQMRLLERVANEVPMKRLRLPNDLEALPAVRELILRDMEHEHQ